MPQRLMHFIIPSPVMCAEYNKDTTLIDSSLLSSPCLVVGGRDVGGAELNCAKITTE